MFNCLMVRVLLHDIRSVEIFLSTEKLQKAKPNLGVLKEYKKREEEWTRRAQEAEDTTKQRDAQKQHYDQLRKQRLDEFMAGFTAISFKLKEMYQVCVSYDPGFFSLYLTSLTSLKTDDYPRRKRRTRACGQHGSVFGRYHLQRYATEEELEEHL
jgi:hypothetical protein